LNTAEQLNFWSTDMEQSRLCGTAACCASKPKSFGPLSLLFFSSIFLSFLIPATCAAAQAASPQGGNSSNSTSSTGDPFGTSFSQNITLTSKSTYSSKRDVDLALSGTWVFKGIGSSLDQTQHKVMIANPSTMPLSEKWEYLLGTSNEYEDTWKATPLSSTVTQKYVASFDALRAINNFSSPTLGKYGGAIAQVGEGHINTQGIRSNAVVGMGYFLQLGALDASLGDPKDKQDKHNSYLLVALQLEGNFVSVYAPGTSRNGAAAYALFRGRKDWGNFDGTISATLTVPFQDTSHTLQSAFDGKLTYVIPSRNVNYSWGITFETTFDYYGVAPPTYDSNAVSPSIGITFSFKAPQSGK
jgi:hypothetical protein